MWNYIRDVKSYYKYCSGKVIWSFYEDKLLMQKTILP